MMRVLKTKIITWIFTVQNLDPYFTRVLKIYIINKYLKHNHRFLQIGELSSYSQNIINNLHPAHTGSTILPKTSFDKTNEIPINIPPLNSYLFLNATVNAYSSSIIIGDQLIVERTNTNAKFNEGFVVSHNKTQALVKNDTIEYIDEGFFLGGNGCYNWYHWLIELAPKLIFKAGIPTNTILVPDVIGTTPSMKQMLETLNNGFFDVVYLKKDINYVVKRLYHINAINYFPFNYINNRIINDTESYVNRSVMKKFRALVMSHFSAEGNFDRVYMVRKTHRVPKNQEQVIAFFDERDFNIINIEDYTLAQQIAIFSRAKFISGVSGAGWSNLIFCQPHTLGICFLPTNFNHLTTFSNLAQVTGVKLIHQFYLNDGHHYSSDFVIDLDELKGKYDYCIKL